MREWTHGKEPRYLPSPDDPNPKVLGCKGDAETYAGLRKQVLGREQRIDVFRADVGLWLVTCMP